MSSMVVGGGNVLQLLIPGIAIEECHKRGLECHAWIVTIPSVVTGR